MKIFLLKTCDSCRKALRELRETGLEPQQTDVQADGVSPADIDRFLAEFGDALVNRRSTTWRGLSEAERQHPPRQLLLDHPKLMKRPVIEIGGQLFLGWGPDVRDQVLGNDRV